MPRRRHPRARGSAGSGTSRVEVADLPAYEDFHANQLASLPGVATVTSYVTMKTLSPDTT
ncbi:Lrp/AsnC ligand binding domain-containing protein [Streptomyces sp. NPDC001410]|uniref:Lrp/AsnC ligand binding domain-containing protein n=1 Tax=Streptomyces sp. NPDC001410 TaxID=3364574 RepID=UPI0036AEA0E4